MFCESERLYIREVELTDIPLIVKWKNDKLLREMSIGDVLVTEENQKNDIERSKEYNNLYLIIIKKETNKQIGYIRVDWLDDNEKLGWLRFGLGEERGKGYAFEALSKVISKLFDNNIQRIDAEAFVINEKSIKLLKSLGFIREGIRREAHFINNKYVDVYVFGLLKEDIKSNK